MQKLHIFLLLIAAVSFVFGITAPTSTQYVGHLLAAAGSIDFKSLMLWQRQGGFVGYGKMYDQEYLDVLCPQTDSTNDESSIVVSRSSPLPFTYVPPGLVRLTSVKTIGVQCVTENTAKALYKLMREAQTDGVELAVTSGYRRPEIQQLTYEFWQKLEGEEKTRRTVATAGHSEHQTGTAIDFGGASQGFASARDDFGEKKEGQWLAQYAHKYGFSLSYPDKPGEYAYEPWHYRFVGVAMARMLHDRNLSFNEYHFLTASGATSSVDSILYNNRKLF